MGNTFQRECGCGERPRPNAGQCFKGEETEPTRTCLPQVDPLHDQRAQGVRQLCDAGGYSCEIMSRCAAKRPDGTPDSPKALPCGWPISMPDLPPQEELLEYYQDLFHFEQQACDVLHSYLGPDADTYLYGRKGKERWGSIEEAAFFYTDAEGKGRGFPRPRYLDCWFDDVEFARLRLIGPHATTLRQVRRADHIPANLDLDEDVVLGRLEAFASLHDACQAGKVYCVDYSTTLGSVTRFGVPPPTFDETDGERHKYAVLCNPIALFYQSNNQQLLPLCIRLYCGAAAKRVKVSPVYTPDDNVWAWTMAKMFFNQADMHYHLIGALYTQTVMVGGALHAMAYSSLSVHHPLRQLLRPHMKGCMAAAERWHNTLVGTGDQGLMANALALDAPGLRELSKTAYLKHDFNNCSFRNDWRERMESEEDLPGYRYRDDGNLVWGAVEEYVMSIVQKYYKKVDDIECDVELKEWFKEMSMRLTRVKELHPARPWDSIVFNATNIIFTCSAMYSARTHGIYDIYGCPLFFPGNPCGTPVIDKDKDDISEEDVVALLPNKRSSLLQIALAYVLAGKGRPPCGPNTEFADYGKDVFVDKSTNQLTQRFQSKLAHIASIIDERNASLEHPYEAMHPQRMKNSFGAF
eukprot:Sspe_Gene.78702::Locus_49254_Transcript_1_1_Confidence_1.000_Length_2077::g.78702::m.78702/K00461/ALOX5; arachidonate 5-lipoxygenase